MASRLDANQIVQVEHDEVAGAKKVTIVNADFAIELSASDGDTIATQPVVVDTATLLSTNAGANATSSAVSCLNYSSAIIAIQYANLTGTLDGVLTIQSSLDDVLYFNDDSTTLSSANGSKLVRLSGSTIPAKFIRANYVANGVTGGTIEIKILLKA